jgi:hypothetical protein
MHQIPFKNPEFFHKLVGDDRVQLLSIAEEGFFWEIHGLSADLWKLMDGELSWAQIKDKVRSSSDLVGDEFDKAADQFLQDLHQNFIILFK